MATNTILIVQVTGKAWMRTADGVRHPLHEGMRVPVDAHIQTETGSTVILQADGVPAVLLGQNTEMLVTEELAQAAPNPAEHAVAAPVDPVADQVLAALDAGQDPFADLDPTAAVLTGGGGGGDSFTRVASIIEPVTPLDLAFPRPGVETPEFVLPGSTAADANAAAITVGGDDNNGGGDNNGDDNNNGGGNGQPPVLAPYHAEITGTEDTDKPVSWNDLVGSDHADATSVTITTVQGGGQLLLNGQPVTGETTIKKDQVDNGQLVFHPAANESGFNSPALGDGVGNHQNDYAQLDYTIHLDAAGGTATVPGSLTIDIDAVVDTPDVTVTLKPVAGGDGDASTSPITQVNGGSGVPGGFDVQDGKIVKIGDGVRIWLSEGDKAPEIVGHAEVVRYSNTDPHGSTDYADVFVVHSGSGYWQDNHWQPLHAVDGNRAAEGTTSPDYIFVQKESGATYTVTPGTNNGFDSNVNTYESVRLQIKGGTTTLDLQGNNHIEGVIYGDRDQQDSLADTRKGHTPIETVPGSTAASTYEIGIHAAVTDKDGSEWLGDLSLTGIPAGATVNFAGTPPVGLELTTNSDGQPVLHWKDGVSATDQQAVDVTLTVTVPSGTPFTGVTVDVDAHELTASGIDSAAGAGSATLDPGTGAGDDGQNPGDGDGQTPGDGTGQPGNGDDCGCGDHELPQDRVQNNLGAHGWNGAAHDVYGVDTGGNQLAGDYESGMTVGHGIVDKTAGDDFLYGGGQNAAGNNLYGDFLESSAVSSSGGNLTLNINGGKDTLCDSDGSGSNLYGDFVRISGVQAFGGDVTINIHDGSDTIRAGDGGGNVIHGDHLEINGVQTAFGHQAQINITLGDDVIRGGSGNDTIYGDYVTITGAQQANVTIQGGNDTIQGGAGNDTMWGGYGNDTFVWKLGDQGQNGAVATDTIKDFGVGQDNLGNDKIDLSDLLSGHQGEDLTHYLQIEGGNNQTTIRISTSGHMGDAEQKIDQVIHIDNVDLTSGFTATGDAHDQQSALINHLIAQSKINVD